ncbi:MAG TPA: S53 family peptidase [Candidatus Eisenbacteria bacterium]|nr:S53 family peptidase [Candidatus Eisenbacteria bacterium]
MSTRHFWRVGVFACITILLVIAMVGSSFAAVRVLQNSTPRIAQSGKNLGPENPATVIEITVRLHHHNLAARDALLQQLYTKGSPQYHKFLTPQQYAQRFGPTAQDTALVQDFLKANGLSIVTTHPGNFYVTARGRIADMQKAFNVSINRFQVNGTTTFANTSDIAIAGPAADVISTVQGLHPVLMKPHSVFPLDPSTGKPFESVALPNLTTSGPPPSIYYENQCYRGVETHAFTTNGQMPIGYYSGNRYGGPINGGQGHYPPCGYEPAAMQIAYGVSPLINSGWDGTGQNVVIVDAFGSPTAAADLSVFSATFGLPFPAFSVYNPDGPPPYNAGWAGETTLDIEWSHSIAPGAGIVLIQALDNYDNHLMNAILFALDNQLGNVISNSYGSDEFDDDAVDMNAWNNLNAYGASVGVSINFSTGDNGDFVRAVGAKTVSVPSNSPYATAVGGTSDFLNPDYSFKFQTGWGTDITRIANPGGTNPPNIPPVCASTLLPGYCFYFGAGGGESAFFAKPPWQSALPGTGRQQPDISMTADPYTGLTIIYSYSHPGTYTVSVIGGTSASCPMFSGLWAITSQATQFFYGHSAGLAAPYVYFMPTGAINDILPASPYTAKNLNGTLMTGGPPIFESAVAISTPDINTQFTNAFYQGTSTRWYGLSFGTDSTLPVTKGWDPVTGVGTPNGTMFINGVLGQEH